MPDRPSDFAALFEALRRARNLPSQKKFADYTEISPAQVNQLVKGHRYLTDDMCERLVDKFPEFEGSLRALLEDHRHLEAELDDLQRVDSLIEKGRPKEARATLDGLLRRTDLSPSVVAEVNARLGGFAFDDGDAEWGSSYLGEAIVRARVLSDSERVTTYTETLALRLTQAERYDEAVQRMYQALSFDLNHSGFWRRLGIIHWYSGELVAAYGALTLALSLGHDAVAVYHARGQVLAELGQHEAAISELSQYLDQSTKPLGRAYARSSRAWAYAQRGDSDLALREFEQAEEETPRNAWLHYFRARCYDFYVGDKQLALQGYRVAIELDAPALTRMKRQRALERIAELDTNE